MDKKVGVSILFGFLLLVAVGITNAVVTNSNDATDLISSFSAVVYGDGFSLDNSTKGGVSEVVNVTVNFGSGYTDGSANITNINVSWTGNYTFDGFIDQEDNFLNGVAYAFNQSTNSTVMNGNVGDWTCENNSISNVGCFNNSADSTLGPNNLSIVIRFNLTAASSIEDIEDLTVNATRGVDGGNENIGNQTSLNLNVDGLAPTLVELNVSDGNTTWENGTFNGSILGGFASFLDSNSPLTITATFYELTPHTGDVMWVYYNGSNIGDVGQEQILNGFAEEKSPTVVQGPLSRVTGVQYSHAIKYTWSIGTGNITNFGTGARNRSIAFVIDANDTFNNQEIINDTALNGADGPFSVLLNDTLPYIANITFLDKRSRILAGGDQTDGNDYLAEGNVSLDFDILGAIKPTSVYSGNDSTIFLAYNTTGNVDFAGYTNGIENAITINLTESNFTTYEAAVANPASRISYKTSLDLAGNDTNTVQMYLVLGNLTTDYTQPGTDQAANYSTLAGPFNIKIDGKVPGATLNTPTNRGLTTSDSIEYICTGTDDASGIGAYRWTLVKPGGATKVYDKVASTSGTNTRKFSGADIQTPGTYDVRCKVFDVVDNEFEVSTTSTNTFTVSISSSGGGSGSSGGGSGAAVSFDVDFTTSPQATFKASQGRVKSFSFDGATKHTITFNEVTNNGVTLIVASDPITIKLNIGQTKEVDINNDGVSDMKIQLNSIANGVADITVIKVDEGADKVKKQEEAVRDDTKTGGADDGRGDINPVAGSSLAWLWWTLIVIVAIVGIGYFINKKK